MTEIELNPPDWTSNPPADLKIDQRITTAEVARSWTKVRTNTNYTTVPFSQLKERGVDTAFLETIVDYIPSGAIIAGGYLTSLLSGDKVNDIDIFFTSKEEYEKMVEKMVGGPLSGYSKAKVPDELKDRFDFYVHPTNPPIQLIKLAFYDNAEHVIDTFDFTAAQLAVARPGREPVLVMNPMAPMDIARKRLVLHRMTFPSSTMRRLVKYSKKGYFACAGALTKIAEETAKVYNQNPMMVRQVVSVD